MVIIWGLVVNKMKAGERKTLLFFNLGVGYPAHQQVILEISAPSQIILEAKDLELKVQ